MPYEILKPMLAEVSASWQEHSARPQLTRELQLNQRDQLSTAKTCVHLWEIAYPMVYDRIVVTVSPDRKEQVWRNLASGICLRYVRHLDIRSCPTASGDKPKCTGDLVAGMILAGMGREQLLSFR